MPHNKTSSWHASSTSYLKTWDIIDYALEQLEIYEIIILFISIVKFLSKIILNYMNTNYIGREYPIAPFRKRDETAKPTPLAERIMISTNSRFLLKYWATINVDVSLVMPTPTPVHNQTNEIDTWLEFQL